MRLEKMKPGWMTGTAKIAVIGICFNEHDGIVHATSPALPTLHVCGKSKEQVWEDIPEVIKLIYKLNHQLEVTVRPAATPEFKSAKKPSKLTEWTQLMIVQLLADLEKHT